MKEIVIDKPNDGQRIEKFVRKYLNEAPLSLIYKAFRLKDVKINGHWVRKDAIVKAGDVVRIYISDQQLADFLKPKDVEKAPFPYEIVYEDENILIVNKPSGILVVGDAKEKRNTLTNKVLSYLYYKNEFDPLEGAFSPAPAHRLDRNTGGLVCFGKNDASLKELTRLFKERDDISKSYLALVAGHPDAEGMIDLPLLKDEETGIVKVSKLGKEAKTAYRLVQKFQDCSLLECHLLTGRTHQIRVHLSSIGHPIVGDGKYGDFAFNRLFKKKYGYDHQFLFAYKMTFLEVREPLTRLRNRTFAIKLDEKEQKIIDSLAKQLQ